MANVVMETISSKVQHEMAMYFLLFIYPHLLLSKILPFNFTFLYNMCYPFQTTFIIHFVAHLQWCANNRCTFVVVHRQKLAHSSLRAIIKRWLFFLVASFLGIKTIFFTWVTNVQVCKDLSTWLANNFWMKVDTSIMLSCTSSWTSAYVQTCFLACFSNK
jgi:hypothetical protein